MKNTTLVGTSCPDCNKPFETEKSMRIHHALVHGGRHPKTADRLRRSGAICDKCDREFKNAHGLAVHLNKIHRRSSKNGDVKNNGVAHEELRPIVPQDERMPGVVSKSEVFHVNGCPNCLMPLKQAKKDIPEGYALNGCPNCRMPLGIIFNAIRIANKHAGSIEERE